MFTGENNLESIEKKFCSNFIKNTMAYLENLLVESKTVKAQAHNSHLSKAHRKNLFLFFIM